MNLNALKFNGEARYTPGVQSDTAEHMPTVVLSPVRVSVTPESHQWFQVEYLNVFEKYRMPHVREAGIRAWNSTPMNFWQNQPNFAVWCATTGCGVSYNDHLIAHDNLAHSLYHFHVYYQIRRILAEIQAPLPQDEAWDALNNPYDHRAYERICSEFGVSPNSNWRRRGKSNGLGRVYIYVTNSGYHPMGRSSGGEYDPKSMSFTEKTTNDILHIEFIQQDDEYANVAWTQFILYRSQGFTRSGVERLNDSIRTYVWAILGSQAQVGS